MNHLIILGIIGVMGLVLVLYRLWLSYSLKMKTKEFHSMLQAIQSNEDMGSIDKEYYKAIGCGGSHNHDVRIRDIVQYSDFAFSSTIDLIRRIKR